jgi:hypothetical protein
MSDQSHPNSDGPQDVAHKYDEELANPPVSSDSGPVSPAELKAGATERSKGRGCDCHAPRRIKHAIRSKTFHHIAGWTEAGERVEVRLTPADSPAANFAFDVTPARLVTALITERGVCPPSRDGLIGRFPERRERGAAPHQSSERDVAVRR